MAYVLTVESAGKTVANFFTPTSQKEPQQTVWRIINNSCIIGRYTPKDAQQPKPPTAGTKRRVAAFDLVCSIILLCYGVVEVLWFTPNVGPHVDRDELWEDIRNGTEGLEVVEAGSAKEDKGAIH